jgi:hypothetical protein
VSLSRAGKTKIRQTNYWKKNRMNGWPPERRARQSTAVQPRMKGIHCALQGRLGADVELRRSQSGKDWARLSVGVGEGDEVAWVSVAVFEEKARALVGFTKGVGMYIEGRLSLNTWTGKDGAQRHRSGGHGMARRGPGADWEEPAGEDDEACGGI